MDGDLNRLMFINTHTMMRIRIGVHMQLYCFVEVDVENAGVETSGSERIWKAGIDMCARPYNFLKL